MVIKQEKSVGEVKPRRWQRFLALVRRHPLRSLIVGIVTIALLVSIAVGIYFFWFAPKDPLDNPDSGHAQYLNELTSQPVPEEPFEQAVYYSQLGQSYEALEMYREALIQYSKAQDVVDQNNLQKRISFYSAIADMAEKIGDQTLANEYYQKADQYTKEYGDKTLEGE